MFRVRRSAILAACCVLRAACCSAEVDLDRLVAQCLQELREHPAGGALCLVEQAAVHGFLHENLLCRESGSSFQIRVALGEDPGVAVVDVGRLVVDRHVRDRRLGETQPHCPVVWVGGDVALFELPEIDTCPDFRNGEHRYLVAGCPVEPSPVRALLDRRGGHGPHCGELSQLLDLLNRHGADPLDGLGRNEVFHGVSRSTHEKGPNDERPEDHHADEREDDNDPRTRTGPGLLGHPTRVPASNVPHMESQMVEVNGTDLFVRTYGPADGYPIVLLHGWPDSGRGWSQVARLLEDRYRLIVPDNRGFGRSAMPEGTDNYRMHVLLADLAGLIAWSGSPRVSVVGHDFGAAVAWQAATFLMDVVDRVVCIAAPHPMRMHEFAGFTRQLTRSFYVWLLNSGASGEALLAHGDFVPLSEWVFGDAIDEVEKREYRKEWSEPGRFTAMAEWYRASFRPELFNPDVNLQLPSAQVPVRYIHGTNDWAFVTEMAEGSGKFVDAEFDEVALSAGHWIPIEHPELVADQIQDWVDRR